MKYMYNNKSKTARFSMRRTKTRARTVRREKNRVSELMHAQESGHLERVWQQEKDEGKEFVCLPYM